MKIETVSRKEILTEYLEVVDSLHGCYLDAITGFCSLVEEYDVARQKMHTSNPKYPLEAFDGAASKYGTDHPRRPQSRVVYSCTQGANRTRSDSGGRNHVVMDQVYLVQIFGYWEDCYRARLAACCGKNVKVLKLDIFGDLRWLRNSIVHHRGVAKDEVKKCKILRWFNEGDIIALTPDHFEQVVSRVRNDLPVYIETL